MGSFIPLGHYCYMVLMELAAYWSTVGIREMETAALTSQCCCKRKVIRTHTASTQAPLSDMGQITSAEILEHCNLWVLYRQR